MEQDRKQGYKNCILTLVVLGASALLMGFFFDFYFDINDDTMIRDIMSGVYSGTPDGHNMQTLYPLGALLALCYRISGAFPWYGAFLFLCQFGCFFLVGVRLCTLTDVFWGIWLSHMVNVQYTITCGMLVGAAVFLFLTMPEGALFGKGTSPLSVKAFLQKSLPALFLVLLAFHLRSEMALLTLPFLGLSGIFGWRMDLFLRKKTCKNTAACSCFSLRAWVFLLEWTVWPTVGSGGRSGSFLTTGQRFTTFIPKYCRRKPLMRI